MTPLQRKALLRLFLLTLLLGGGAFAVALSPLSSWYLPAFPVLLLSFALIYFLFAWGTLAAASGDEKSYLQRFLLMMGVKFLLLLLLMTVYLALTHPHRAPFVVTILILYILYSTITYTLLLRARKKT